MSAESQVDFADDRFRFKEATSQFFVEFVVEDRRKARSDRDPSRRLSLLKGHLDSALPFR